MFDIYFAPEYPNSPPKVLITTTGEFLEVSLLRTIDIDLTALKMIDVQLEASSSRTKAMLFHAGGGSVRFGPNLYNCGKVRD